MEPQNPTMDEPDDPPALRIRLLGGVAATRGGEPVDVGPAKCQTLLAALALSVGTAVPVPRLVELVWGDAPPRTAEKTLQSYVTKLRKGLGHEAIVRAGTAYRLDVEPEAVDVARFERHLADGDLTAALAVWGGPPLAGLDPAGLGGAINGLTERWLGAVEDDLDRLVSDDPATSIGRLTELVAAHPFREGLWALLMTSLYATGRQAEALAAYRRARAHLVEELGVEPGPRLRDLEARILDHDDDLDASRGPNGRGRPRSDGAGPGDPPTLPTGTVTFAFSDVENATGLWSSDRHLATAAIARHDEIVRAGAAANGGHVFANGGDTLGVAFHRADHAARWAQAVQAAVADEPWATAGAPAVRIGIHTGDAEERDGNYFGPPVNVASRVATAGHGGQILLSGVTAALLNGPDLRRALRDLGPVQLDGLTTTLAVTQLGHEEHPPLRVTDGRRGNLPRSVGPLIGRDDLLDAVVKAVHTSSVVTLVGPGGIGKTRLALAAATLAAAQTDRPDRSDRPNLTGAWLVELADVTSSDDVTRAVAATLDITEIPGRTLLDAVVAALEFRQALVVLDNCEHVIDGAADLVEAVRASAADVRILATSREGLGVDGEQLVVVGPLEAHSAGVELFTQRALAVDRTFDPEAHRHTVAEICRRLDGVPLAIELAAARIRTLAPEALVERLDDSFRVLTGGRRRSVERHRTLRATIQWSHDLLTPAEQVLFRRLSIFAGSFDLVAAERVAAGSPLPEADVGMVLDDLIERSMVLVESGLYSRRFRLLETMRQFGAEQLAEHEEPDEVAARHGDYVAAEVAHLADLLDGWGEIEGAARLAELWPNLRVAFDWAETSGDVELAKRLIGPIAHQAITRRGVAELADWGERLLALIPPDDIESRSLALVWTSFHYSTTGDRAAFRRLVERVAVPDNILARAACAAVLDDTEHLPDMAMETMAELNRRGDDRLARLYGIFVAGSLLGSGRLDEAIPRIDELVARFRVDGPPTFLNWSLYLQGTMADFQGDTEAARRSYDEALAVEVPPLTNSPNEVLRARSLFRQGRHRQAYAVLRDYAADLIEVGNMSSATLLAIELINMTTAIGRLDLAGLTLGYIERTGLLDVEGPAFRLLIEESTAIVAADPEAAATMAEAAATDGVDDAWAMRIILSMLTDLVDETPDHPLSA